MRSRQVERRAACEVKLESGTCCETVREHERIADSIAALIRPYISTNMDVGMDLTRMLEELFGVCLRVEVVGCQVGEMQGRDGWKLVEGVLNLV